MQHNRSNMSSDNVRRLIEQQVDGDWNRRNAHGCTIRHCLVEPQKRTFAGTSDGDTFDLWLVLEEDPEARDGYKVVYDEEVEAFGLACAMPDGYDLYLGIYGSFLNAYDAM